MAIIPARSGSKGVPDKNIRDLGGVPLMGWTIRACIEADIFDRVIVSTDSTEYAAVAREWGAETPFLRPAELASDRAGDLETLQHAISTIDPDGDAVNLVAHMRPTTPLRDPKVIAQAVDRFRDADGATALRSVEEMAESAYKTFEVTDAGHLRRLASDSTSLDAANAPRQSFPSTYRANGYVDVLSRPFMARSGLLHGDAVLAFVTDTAPEVDTEDDLNYIQFLVTHRPKIRDRVFPERAA